MLVRYIRVDMYVTYFLLWRVRGQRMYMCHGFNSAKAMIWSHCGALRTRRISTQSEKGQSPLVVCSRIPCLGLAKLKTKLRKDTKAATKAAAAACPVPVGLLASKAQCS